MMHISIMGDTSYIPTYNWEAPHCMRSFLMKVRTSVVYHMDADVMHIVSYTIYTHPFCRQSTQENPFVHPRPVGNIMQSWLHSPLPRRRQTIAKSNRPLFGVGTRTCINSLLIKTWANLHLPLTYVQCRLGPLMQSNLC